jgi:AraC family transcriptional regulator
MMLFLEQARLAPGERLRRHAHAEGHLCVVEAGGFRERVARRSEECAPGTVRISLPGTEHDLEAGAMGAACVVAGFPGEILEAVRVPARPSLFARGPRAIAAFRAALGSQAPDREWRLESALLELLAEAARGARLRRAGPPPAWLLRVRDRLAETRVRPELARLAAAEGVDPCHLARAFRDHFGVPATDWYRRRRVARARLRIAAGGDPLAAIALETGFADQAHLCREFRRACGMSPAAWRRVTQSAFKTEATPRGRIRA